MRAGCRRLIHTGLFDGPRNFCPVRVTGWPRHLYVTLTSATFAHLGRTASMGDGMSQQYPQQPQWGGPQQPAWGAPPPPPKGRSAGKIIGFGCLGIIGLLVAIGVIAAVVNSGGSSNKTSSSPSTTTATHSASSGGSGKAKVGGAKTSKPADVVTFKVWGTAPAGALGPLDIGYGSDSDTRKGTFKNGKFTATLPLTKGAMYFNVNAQLQGSGDIHCSVTVGGKTKTGHASGGFNICSAQLSSNFTGGWS